MVTIIPKLSICLKKTYAYQITLLYYFFFNKFCVITRGDFVFLQLNLRKVLPLVCNTDFTQTAIAPCSFVDLPRALIVFLTFLIQLQKRLPIDSYIVFLLNDNNKNTGKFGV